MKRLEHSPARLAILAALVMAGCLEETPPAPDTSNVPDVVEAVSGQGQRGRTNTPLSEQLSVRVLNSRGVPLAGVRVYWTTPDSTHGSASPVESRTNGQGVAMASWTLGTVHEQRLVANIGGPPSVTFTALADGMRLTCEPASASYAPGQIRAGNCSVTSLGDFTGTVVLSTVSVPAGLEVNFARSTIVISTPGGSGGTTTQISVSSGMAAGTYAVPVRAVSGADSASFFITVIVT